MKQTWTSFARPILAHPCGIGQREDELRLILSTLSTTHKSPKPAASLAGSSPPPASYRRGAGNSMGQCLLSSLGSGARFQSRHKWEMDLSNAVEGRRALRGAYCLARHTTDVPVLLSALASRPDWLLTHNIKHFTPTVAERTGLKIATPKGFFQTLSSVFP
jgi:hypothetical protein